MSKTGKKKGLGNKLLQAVKEMKEGKKVERMRKPGSKGAPTAEALEKSKSKKRTSKAKFE